MDELLKELSSGGDMVKSGTKEERIARRDKRRKALNENVKEILDEIEADKEVVQEPIQALSGVPDTNLDVRPAE